MALLKVTDDTKGTLTKLHMLFKKIIYFVCNHYVCNLTLLNVDDLFIF